MECRKCKKEIQDTPFCPFCGAKQTPVIHHTRRGNGMGSAYKYRSGWRCEVTVGFEETGKRIVRTKSGFKTKKEALEYVPTLLNRVEPAVRTLKYYYDSWSKSDCEKLSSSKQTAYRVAWNKLSDIHQLKVKNLTIVQLREIVSEVAPTFYPAKDCKSLLSHLFKLAIADQQITINMAEYISLPKQNETEQSPWNADEIKTIWKSYENGSQMAAYLLLMIYTGMMPGELMNCTKDAIDLEHGQIYGIGLKTDIRKKTPIILASYMIPVVEQILTFTPSDYPKILKRNRWDFYGDYAKYKTEVGIRDLPMYSCRHTTATALALSENIPPSVIQKTMRHSKFSTTQRYIHPDMEDTRTALEKISPA